jgi:hypothetical protein
VSGLAEALVAFQGDMPTVHKGKTATVPTKTGGSYKYTYADLADVSAAATPLLVRHGLAFTCRPRAVDGGSYELVGVLTHTSGEEKEGALPIFGRTAQEIGSSITYGRRYLLGCLTGIVTDDDEDGQVATQTQERTQRQPPRPSPLELAQVRVQEAWHARNPESGGGLAEIAEHYAAYNLGGDIRTATVPQLIAYAETLEATP